MPKPSKSAPLAQSSDTHELPVVGYTKADAARMLTLSLKSLDNLIKHGALRHVKLGRRVLIPASAIDDLLHDRDA